MTMTQKILAAKAGKTHVSPGELIEATVDLCLANDITAPVSVNEFERAGFQDVFDRDKVVFVLDHFTPNKDIKSAEQCKHVRAFAKKHQLSHFYDGGCAGVEHVLLPEQGLVAAGDLVTGADSHTCTYGALGAFSTGMGSTDITACMASGKTWLKVPDAIKIELRGTPAPFVCGKDVMLYIIGQIGVDGALYRSMEFVGDGVAALSMDDRFTIANMAVEAGAKNGIFMTDDKTEAYIRAHGSKPYVPVFPDADAVYARTLTVDLAALTPMVAFPHLPSNVRPVSAADHLPIDQVVIGSCTNGRLSDLAIAASLLRGKHISRDVRCIIIPATPTVYSEAMERGYLKIFMDAGAIVSAPTCGPCLGGHMGVLAAGERALATTNRNFVGRMGHPDSEVYLCSPAVAAASAVTGCITDPQEGEVQ